MASASAYVNARSGATLRDQHGCPTDAVYADASDHLTVDVAPLGRGRTHQVEDLLEENGTESAEHHVPAQGEDIAEERD